MGYIFKVYVKDLLIDIHNIKKNIITIGRHTDNDIVLKGDSISRLHAEVSITSDGALVVQEKGVNGTFVSGKKINDEQNLNSGDFISIGPYKIIPEEKKLAEKDPKETVEHSETVIIDITDNKLKKSLATNYTISEREHEIIELLIKGKSNIEVSKILFISPYTVKTHVQHIFEKMGISKRTQLVGKILDLKNELGS